MDASGVLLQHFDMQKLSKCCNIQECQKPPSKETVFIENQIATYKKRDIASVFLCKTHYVENIGELMEKMNECRRPGCVIEKMDIDINFITY